MASRDLYNNIEISQSWAPIAVTAEKNGTTVDTQGYESAVAVLDVGAMSASYPDAATFVLHESDDDSTWSTVATADIQGASGETATIAITVNSDNTVYKRGYLGTARYLRWECTVATDSPSVVVGAYIILSNPRHAPV